MRENRFVWNDEDIVITKKGGDFRDSDEFALLRVAARAAGEDDGDAVTQAVEELAGEYGVQPREVWAAVARRDDGDAAPTLDDLRGWAGSVVTGKRLGWDAEPDHDVDLAWQDEGQSPDLEGVLTVREFVGDGPYGIDLIALIDGQPADPDTITTAGQA